MFIIEFLQIFDLAYDKAKIMLQKNFVVLEKVVEELLEYEILTGKVCFSISIGILSYVLLITSFIVFSYCYLQS